jgi:putative ABC transport system permease protein
VLGIAPRYFEVLGAGMLRGRDFSDRDGRAGEKAAIVNERFAKLALAGADPLGRRIALGPPAPGAPPRWLTIVGIAPDIRQRPVAWADPIVYVPLAGDAPATVTVLVRGAPDVGVPVSHLREALQRIDPGLPLFRAQTLARMAYEAAWNGRVANRMILALTTIAVVLATFGLYAVTAHAVVRRAQEIGLRMALGARAGQVMALVLRGALGQTALGFSAGVLLVLVWDRTFPPVGANVSPLEVQTLALVAGVLVAASAIACVIPAYRATRVAPAVTLRQE